MKRDVVTYLWKRKRNMCVRCKNIQEVDLLHISIKSERRGGVGCMNVESEHGNRK